MRSCRVLRTRWILAAAAIVAVASVASHDAVAQMHGVPGAPQARMGGMGGSGVQRPMAGSSVPMMGRQGAMRSGQQSFSGAPQGSRFSGQFRASQFRGQGMGMGMGGVGATTAEGMKSQVKAMARPFGF